MFGVPLFRYHLDPTEIKKNALERYNRNKDIPLDGIPNGWDCNLKTDFHDSRDNRYSNYYDDVMKQFGKDVGLTSGHAHMHESWLNYYTKGMNQEEHDHLPGFYSAIHYVKFNPDVHEPAVFTNPLIQLYSYMNNEINYKKHPDYILPDFTPEVKEGEILIFPSWLKHTVKRTTTDEHRITLAFNINTMKGSTRRVFGQQI